MPTENLHGPTMAITGGASGIGLETARQWVAAGRRVVLLDRDAQSLQEATQQLGPQARSLVLDVSDPASVTAAFEDIAAQEMARPARAIQSHRL